MQAAFFAFQHASKQRLSAFYDPFAGSNIPAEISNCLLELEIGFVSFEIVAY